MCTRVCVCVCVRVLNEEEEEKDGGRRRRMMMNSGVTVPGGVGVCVWCVYSWPHHLTLLSVSTGSNQRVCSQPRATRPCSLSPRTVASSSLPPASDALHQC